MHLYRGTKRADRNSHLEASFITLRIGMSALGFIFPCIYLVSAAVGHVDLQTSLSAYYWTLPFERNVFVGALCPIGVFLIFYKGYTTFEDWLLNIAGVCAIGAALFAMTKDSDCIDGGYSAHSVFAVTFFACIAYACIVMSNDSLDEKRLPPEKEKLFRILYWICALVMAAAMIASLILRFFPAQTNNACLAGATFWIETAAIWAFAAFWYIKTRELDPSASWMPFGKKGP